MADPLNKARLTSLVDQTYVEVHFNPASLVYTVDNHISQTSKDPNKVQYVAQYSGKLTMDLQFDTTHTGDDVRSITGKVAKFMEPVKNATHPPEDTNSQTPPAQPASAPPVLLFEWGAYTFQGIMESFKETIDLFSSEGVALRSLVGISLARQDLVFADNSEVSQPGSAGTVLPPASPQFAAQMGGDPRAARQLASDNGQESIRFSDGTPLKVNAAPQLNPPAAFVRAAGAGAGASASFGSGVNGSASAGAGFSTGGALFGSKASAGVSATAGAFAGLQTGRATISTTAQLDPMRIVPATVGADVSTSAGASFSLGGSANSSTSAGLSADVGVNFRFSDRLTFDND